VHNYQVVYYSHGFRRKRGPLSSTQISESIANKTGGKIFKVSGILKDSIEHRLKREGYVESKEIKNKSIYSLPQKVRNC
jgi:hypothetical protein